MPQIAPLVAGDPPHLGSFRLSGRIGEGGQGIVYLGVNDEGERAAIKLLHVKFSGDTIARSRFARELKAAQRVASFCTARVMEADLDGDTPYIASEYIEGRSLRELIETDGPLSGTPLDRLAIGTATALTAIHHAHIVHRDFKPDNVLIAADGPRVVDFGIARIIDSTGTITSRAIGTPAYMAPEQIAGDEIGPYTDVFSWGATITFAATGTTVFEGKSIATVLNRILNHEVDVAMLPEPLRGVVAGALAKAPAERPSADQILLRLLGQSTGVGASTAVLTRGVQVAGDDTTPFSRVNAKSVTDLPAHRGAGSLVPAEHGPPAQGQRGAAAQEARGATGQGTYEGQAAALTTPPVRRAGDGGRAGDAGQPPYPVPTEPSAPARRRPRWRLWAAFAGVLVLVAGAAMVAAMNGWPLAFREQRVQPTTPSEPSFASVVDKVATTGKIVIGVKGDLPGVGLQNGEAFEGFDIELARRIATGLGARETKLVRVSRDDRPAGLAEGTLDLVVATYVIDGRTAFAGPYYLAHRDVLVRAGSGVEELGDLAGKRVCAPSSPSVGEVQDRVKVKPVLAGNYAECMDLLRAGKVEAVPGEDVILAGFANREPLRYKILGAKLSNERYGVGVRPGDAATCKAVNGIIADLYRSGAMKGLLDQYFGKVDFKPELRQPAMETCE
ncbi:Serine/threonine-protein kinase AfsK [Nonomuraea coxensis DSM 45129]|uniref:Serine/threonine-protein kinase AfsK n=1 Tax=Nonomuraea coxensis DSM 45129 TaxID=1122611 RepID=A0ABX8TT29_9ACTN|nr:serine/threonine-protein kinase [Nonomuraea coxensis]QYC38630.1 Serine/threonine-protein kinase AfsK [Nonomuraea coxensis DSM 45129]